MPYLYKFSTDTYELTNNDLRQLMMSRLLAQIAVEDTMLAPLHRANLQHVMNSWFQVTVDSVGYMLRDGKSKLGANAMALYAIAVSPFYGEYERHADKLARGILSLMDTSGALRPWFKEPEYQSDADYLLTFYSGEAILALLEYSRRSGRSDMLAAAIRAQKFYLGKYVDDIEQWYYPAYVPWHTITLNRLWKLTKEERYLTAAMRLNDELLKILDTTDVVGRFYDPAFPQFGTPHSSSDAVYTEGLAYAYELAVLGGDQEHAIRYRHALRLAVGNLLSLQVSAYDVPHEPERSRALGAVRVKHGSDIIRIDCTQHTMDAFRKFLEVW